MVTAVSSKPEPLPDWDENSPRLQDNLQRIAQSLAPVDGKRPDISPGLEYARRWHRQVMSGLAVPDDRYIGNFRGEYGLERLGVRVGVNPGTPPWHVLQEVEVFEEHLKIAVDMLDSDYPTADDLDEDGMNAVIELAGWAHAEWVRIHPFANGNGRIARIWANFLLMRYGLPPAVRLRPRPEGDYGAAGASAMRGDVQPTIDVVRQLVFEAVGAGEKPKRAPFKKAPPKDTRIRRGSRPTKK